MHTMVMQLYGPISPKRIWYAPQHPRASPSKHLWLHRDSRSQRVSTTKKQTLIAAHKGRQCSRLTMRAPTAARQRIQCICWVSSASILQYRIRRNINSSAAHSFTKAVAKSHSVQRARQRGGPQTHTTETVPKYYSSTTLYYKVLLQYFSVLQSTTPVLLCTTKYYSSTNLYYKVVLRYYFVLLQY